MPWFSPLMANCHHILIQLILSNACHLSAWIFRFSSQEPLSLYPSNSSWVIPFPCILIFFHIDSFSQSFFIPLHMPKTWFPRFWRQLNGITLIVCKCAREATSCSSVPDATLLRYERYLGIKNLYLDSISKTRHYVNSCTYEPIYIYSGMQPNIYLYTTMHPWITK